MSSAQSFTETFKTAFQQVKDDAKAAGLTMTDVCTRVGCSRATPIRWDHEAPKTVSLLTRMQQVIREKIEEDRLAADEHQHTGE